MLCRSIIYQQLSGKAASTIMMRFLGLYEPDILTPEALLRTTDDTLRGIGLSRQKITYLKDLATKSLSEKPPKPQPGNRTADRHWRV
jgi:DNA-3-methyladenine glycosylase II